MRRVNNFLALSTLAAVLTGGVAIAQDHHDDQQAQEHHDKYVRHNEWKRGARMKQEDWSRGERVDYRQHHLRKPPSGYEWRAVDGNYVLASGSGVISSVEIQADIH